MLRTSGEPILDLNNPDGINARRQRQAIDAIHSLNAERYAATGDVVATAAGERLTLMLLGECAAVARAAGFATDAETLAKYRAMLTQKNSVFTASMLRDIEAGGQTEGDHILGELLALARKHGIATPLLEVAVTHLEAYAARKRREALAT